MKRLINKTAIVTGAGRGLGRAIAEAFAREGAAVLVTDVQDDLGTDVTDAIVKSDGQARFQHLDVTQEDEWTYAVERCRTELGAPDILVNNAMVWYNADIAAVTVEEWHRGLDVMLNGTFYGIRAVLPDMRARKAGSIVSVGSPIGGAIAIPAMATYQAAKAGIIALTRHVAVTYGTEGIRANSLLPGPMYTPGLAETGFAESAEGIAAHFPLGRIAQPEEVAAGALFLASDESGYMTGSCLAIDGGHLAI